MARIFATKNCADVQFCMECVETEECTYVTRTMDSPSRCMALPLPEDFYYMVIEFSKTLSPDVCPGPPATSTVAPSDIDKGSQVVFVFLLFVIVALGLMFIWASVYIWKRYPRSFRQRISNVRSRRTLDVSHLRLSELLIQRQEDVDGMQDANQLEFGESDTVEKNLVFEDVNLGECFEMQSHYTQDSFV